MAPRKKKSILKTPSIIVLVVVIGVIGISALLIFDTELFIQEADVDVDVGSLSVTPEVGEDLPKEVIVETVETNQTNGVDFQEDQETEVVSQIAETKESRFQAFLENIGFSSIDQFGIGTIVELRDIANNTKQFNSILPVILLDVTTVQEDFNLDVADIEFRAVLKDPQSTNLNLEGTVQFFVDNDLIDTKRIFASETIRDVNNIQLQVVDTIPPPLGDDRFNFIYQFDENEFDDLTTHTFRVVINQLSGTYQTADETRFIDFNGIFIAYELEFFVDQSLMTVIDENGEALSVLKNDNTLFVCGSPSRTDVRSVSGTHPFLCRVTIPPQGILFDVRVFENIGSNVTGAMLGEVLATDNTECQSIEGLSRSHDYIIQVGNENIPVTTPRSQMDYNVNFRTGGGKALISSINGGEFRSGTFVGWECLQREIFDVATSNFGYSFDSRD